VVVSLANILPRTPFLRRRYCTLTIRVIGAMRCSVVTSSAVDDGVVELKAGTLETTPRDVGILDTPIAARKDTAEQNRLADRPVGMVHSETCLSGG
jgi:hypothetical protein